MPLFERLLDQVFQPGVDTVVLRHLSPFYTAKWNPFQVRSQRRVTFQRLLELLGTHRQITMKNQA
jgi:hypothetical protein